MNDEQEHRVGMIDLAQKVGFIQGTQKQLLKEIEKLVTLVEKNATDTLEIKQSIPKNHVEVHAILEKKLEAANDYARFWHDIRCWIALAISSKTRTAVLMLVLGAIFMIGGWKDGAAWLVAHAKALLGLAAQ